MSIDKPMFDSSDSQTDPEMLLQLVADVRITNYAAVASLTWLLYDHVICFGEEVELMWKDRRWKAMMKTCYLLNRYLCVVAISLLTILRFTERPSDFIEGTTFIIIVVMVDSVLALRVWLLYEKDTRLLLLFIPLILVEFAVMLLIESLVVPRAEGNICPSLLAATRLTYRFSQAIFILDLFLRAVIAEVLPHQCFLNAASLILYPLSGQVFHTLWRLMPSLRRSRCLKAFRMGVAGKMPTITLFLRDGIFWFLGVMTCIIATVLNLLVGRPTLVDLTNTLSVVIFSLIASHSLLNLKRIINVDAANGNVISHYDSAIFRGGPIIFAHLGQPEVALRAPGENSRASLR
ncbi:hypothetical protein FPV67DRAFT_1647715 [Lyophyllum atratum]|nr:hypothetical protein FPV67DRAFT_1647715 [Lyophyllum atratum]